MATNSFAQLIQLTQGLSFDIRATFYYFGPLTCRQSFACNAGIICRYGSTTKFQALLPLIRNCGDRIRSNRPSENQFGLKETMLCLANGSRAWDGAGWKPQCELRYANRKALRFIVCGTYGSLFRIRKRKNDYEPNREKRAS